MACLLFFNFALSLIATTIIITGITTSRWLVFIDGTNSNIRSERSIGIINSCQRLYRLADTDQYLTFSNGSSHSVGDDAFVCFNRLLKWNNASSSGPELFGKLKKPMKFFSNELCYYGCFLIGNQTDKFNNDHFIDTAIT